MTLADRLPSAVAVAVIVALASPFIAASWRGVFTDPAPLEEDAFDVGPIESIETDQTEPLTVPAGALTASLYDDLSPRPAVAETSPAPREQAQPRLTIELVAITINPEGDGQGPAHSAYVFDTALREYTLIRPGDTLEAGGRDVTVKAIDSSGITLTVADRDVRLELET